MPRRRQELLLEDVRVRALLGSTLALEMRKLDGVGKVRRGFRGQRWVLDFGRKLSERRFIYTWNGQPLATKSEAEALLLQVRRHVAEGMRLESAVASILGADVRENSVGARIERWLRTKREEAEAGDLSPTYLRELERWFSREGHIGAWWCDKPITSLNLTSIREWATWLNSRSATARKGSQEKPRRLSPKTRWNVHAAFHVFAAWLGEEDRRVQLPKRWPWPTRKEPAVTIISVETQDAILESIPDERRGVFLAMAMLGIRPGEAVALDVGDYRDNWLTVSKARKGERLTSPIRGTKTGKVKRLPVPDELREWIERYHTPRSRLRGGPLFPNPEAHGVDGRWSAAALRRAWMNACAKVGVKVGLYAGTKHAMATHLLGRGVQERHIQALLGHADVRSTRHYARLADQALVEALAQRKRQSGR